MGVIIIRFSSLKSHLFLNIELGPLFAARGQFLPSISI